MKRPALFVALAGTAVVVLAACGSGGQAGIDPSEVVRVIQRDGIISIDDPKFDSATEAQAYLQDEELILGVVVEGEARAYPIDILSLHEIVNDRVGGTAFAVTW